jgi:hypothetical protein
MPHPLPRNEKRTPNAPAKDGMLKDGVVSGLALHYPTNEPHIIFWRPGVGLVADPSTPDDRFITTQAGLQLHPALIKNVYAFHCPLNPS